MATLTKSVGSSSTQTAIPPQLASSKINTEVTAVALRVMQTMARDHYTRVTTCDKGNAKTTLSGGCFYPNDYAVALAKTGQVERLNLFKERGYFHYGFASPKHFNFEEDKTALMKRSNQTFLLKPGVAPGEALKAIQQGPSLICCGEACSIAYYEAIKSYLGESKFNALFDSNSRLPLRIGLHNDPKNPLNTTLLLLGEFNTAQPFEIVSEKIRKGQLIHITGPENYITKHPFGTGQGMNVLCIDDTPGAQKFIGLGLNPEGASYEEVCDYLLADFNEYPIKAEAVLSKEITCSVEENHLSETTQKMQKYIDEGKAEIVIETLLTDSPSLEKPSPEEMKTLTTDAKVLTLFNDKAINSRILSKEDFFKEGGGKILINEIDMQHLTDLKKATVPQGKALLYIWNKEFYAS